MTELDNPVKKVTHCASESDYEGHMENGQAQKLYALSDSVTCKSLDGAFDRITRLACRLFNVPLAVVNLIHAGKIWHQSYCDISHGNGTGHGFEFPVCLQSVLSCGTDASLNMQQFPQPVKGMSCALRFYASVPLVSSTGSMIGNFCIFDKDVRSLDESEVAALKDLAAIALDEIELRLSEPLVVKDDLEHEETWEALREGEARYNSLIDLLSDWQWEQDSDCRFTFISTASRIQVNDPHTTHANYMGKTFRELPELDMTEEDWHEIDQATVRRQPFQDFTLKWRGEDGKAHYTAISGQPIFSTQGWFKGYRGVAKDITEKVHAHEEMMQTNAALLELSVGYQTFREAERKKIARELHEELAQLLATSRMELCLLQQDLTPKAESRNRLDSLDQMIGSSIVSLRRIATDLRPSSLDEGGLYYALRTLLKTFSETEKIDCQLIANEEDLHLDEARSTAIFRLIQESLANIKRHARAGKAIIQIYRSGKKLELRIQDDGKGIRPDETRKEKAYGLLDMRSRVAEMNGKIEIKGQPQKGTRIAISLPLFE